MKMLRDLSDNEVLELCASGHEEYLNVLITKYKNRVMSYIQMKVCNKDVADDIFQESFIRVLLSLRAKKYEENGKFISWFIRIAHNLIIDYYRRQKNAQVIHDSDVDYDLWSSIEMSNTSDSIESEMIYYQLLDEVSLFVKILPECQRKVIEMRHYSDMSFKEIAEETDVSINTALGRMRYGLMNLRRMIYNREAV